MPERDLGAWITEAKEEVYASCDACLEKLKTSSFFWDVKKWDGFFFFFFWGGEEGCFFFLGGGVFVLKMMAFCFFVATFLALEK